MKSTCQPWHQYNQVHVGVLSIYYQHCSSVSKRPDVRCKVELQERHCRKIPLSRFPKLALFLYIVQESFYTSKRRKKDKLSSQLLSFIFIYIEINTQVLTCWKVYVILLLSKIESV